MRNKLRVCITVSSLLLIAPGAFAQVSNLDKATLIEGLRDQRMTSLLEHLIDTELKGEDPVLGEQAYINMRLLEYKEETEAAEQITDPQAREDAILEAREKFHEALDRMRKMIAEHPDHVQRPLWQTNLAQELLFENAQYIHNFSSEFVEYGVPTEDQTEAFEDAIVEALEQLTDADRKFFSLQADVPRRSDFAERFENTGLWNRMMNEFYKLRTQYFLALASHYAAMVSDDHAYFQNLKNNSVIPPDMQKANAAEEKARLRGQALERAQRILEVNRDISADPKLRTQLLIGRAEVALERPARAVEPLAEVISSTVGDQVNLEAQLTRAKALFNDSKQGEAMSLMAELSSHPLLSQNAWWRLIVTDRTHLFELEQARAIEDADQRRLAIENAYEPYISLLTDPEFTSNPGRAEALKNYVFKRWESSLSKDANLTELPALVLRAVAETARLAGQNGMIEARETASSAMNDQGEVADEELMQQAMQQRDRALEKLQRAISVADVLLARESADNQMKAEALYNKAVATFFTNLDDSSVRVETAMLMTQLADEYSDQREMAASAAGESVALLRPIFIEQLRGGAQLEHMPEAYHHAVNDVLFAKFPGSKGADGERLFYAFTVLRPKREFRAAAEMLAGIPSDHPHYWEGQRERLYSLIQIIDDRKQDATLAEDEAEATAIRSEVDALVDEVVSIALNLRNEANTALPIIEDAQRPLVLDAKGHARLVLARMYAEQDNATEAINVLTNFEAEHANDPGLVSQALERRILALAATGNFEDMNAQARVMMDQFPDDASFVIENVLRTLEQQIQAARQVANTARIRAERQAANASAASKAEAGIGLAKLLGEWARVNKLEGVALDEILLIEAQAYRLAGQAELAIERLRPVRERNPDYAPVIHNLAEAYFQRAQGDDLITNAAPLYNTLINSLPKEEDGSYGWMYWNAWMRRLQINDRLNQATDDIVFRVRQLELVDPELGGEPYKSELQRLKNKYSLGS